MLEMMSKVPTGIIVHSCAVDGKPTYNCQQTTASRQLPEESNCELKHFKLIT